MPDDGDWKAKRKEQLGSREVPIATWVDYQLKLLKAFGDHPAVVGIELMNEPHDLPAQGQVEPREGAITVALAKAALGRR